MGGLSPVHVILLLLVVLLVFGSKRIVGLGKDLGQGIRGLRDSIADDGKDDDAKPSPDLAQPSDQEVTEALVGTVGPEGAVRARQTTPAPTPEIAEAEVAEEQRPA
jgi:sec-independent protein translocase protein TatA